MSKNTIIKSYQIVYPQIYSYILPSLSENEGSLKNQFIRKKNVDDQIIEQTKTAALD